MVTVSRKLTIDRHLHMGDTEYESPADSLENTSISKPGDALSDEIARDVTLCELVILWSALDEPIRQAILTIARRSS